MTKTNKHVIDLMDFQWKARLAATDVAKSSEDHGDRHWRDVAQLGAGIAYATRLPSDEFLAVFCFAAIHDTQRFNEFHDPEHGARAAEAARAISPPFPLLQEHIAEKLEQALIGHDKGETSDDPFIGACWDADRLTLMRVGIQPSIDYISTEYVRDNFAACFATAEQLRTGPGLDWFRIADHYTRLAYQTLADHV